ncbi:MAG: SoxR reducing system RseC family protein [Desulfobacteraceae bacterium]|nr:SoxR reducing system RseC family protein [Desulfobacterales bacterium]MBL6967441.1 SoxR reducing system RseC family protein [Desulfobacteraceae bacterium]MBL7101142.1 SoxR reducing system RseC family protein [Desulfobacteraceae bacterium]MBL7171452.1 SoxR reducing system RseC family protein [Desulfobacteraceae bacterium]
MVSEQGVIEEVSGQKALVRIEKTSACATCGSRGACEAVFDKAMIVEVTNDLGAGKGDRVEISVSTGSYLKLSLFVYFFPVVALIAGAIAGGTWAHVFQLHPTLASIVGGCLAMGITFYALKRLDRSSYAKSEFQPRMTRILR